MKKNAFTLIELLAVIAILAIILVISIPKILDVIETSKINTLKNAVKLIADSAEKKYTENEAFGEENEITCDSVSKLNKEDYNKCTIIFDENGIAKVSILGRGKFKGLKVIEATKTSAEVIKLEAPKYGITAVEYIKQQYEYDGDGLKIDNTPDENIRYYGANPNNYVSFNNELWRIIGVFGNNVKLIRSEKLGNLSWDSSEESINEGRGVNEWNTSALKNYLNTMYYDGTSVTCYNANNKQTTTCPANKLDNTAKALIDNHTWKTGAIDLGKRTNTLAFYKDERGNVTGKICNGGASCNDTVERTTEWPGYIGLPYVTDWAYASSESICETNMQKKDSSNAYICKNNNWMFKLNTWYWTISPGAYYGISRNVWYVGNVGFVNHYFAADGGAIFPAIYLKSNILIESGKGTSSDPYILKAGA